MEEKRRKANAEKKRRQREKKKEQKLRAEMESEKTALESELNVIKESGPGKMKSTESRSRQRLQLGVCDFCGKELVDGSKFEIHESQLYCSQECVRRHRRKVMAEAAERRLKG